MNTSDYIALAASIIAMSALGVSIWQGYLARRHNILSVKPILQFTRNHLGKWVISLTNDGLGPALITRFTIEFYGQNYVNPNQNIYLNYVQMVGGKLGLESVDYRYTIPAINSPISSGEILRIFEIKDLTEDQIKIVEKSIKFEICYTSIYGGKEFVLKSNSL